MRVRRVLPARGEMRSPYAFAETQGSVSSTTRTERGRDVPASTAMKIDGLRCDTTQTMRRSPGRSRRVAVGPWIGHSPH